MSSEARIIACKNNWKKALAVMALKPKLRVKLFCGVCGTAFEVEPYRAGTAMYCSAHCRQTGISRKTAVKRAEALRRRGNVKTYRKWFGRHLYRVVAESKLGRPLAQGEIVHHIDGDRMNNVPENLEIISQSDHIKGHFGMMLERRKEAAGY